MSNSNIKLRDVYDALAAKGYPDPRDGNSGYGDTLGLEIATEALADIVQERFPWKWNSAVATPFYTNSFQQDYPQAAQVNGAIGWGETCTCVDINNTMIPKPLWNLSWRRQLLPTTITVAGGPVTRNWAVCWMYNKDLRLGTWPGAGVTYFPLLGVNAPAGQNPLMSLLDVNGNILIVTTFGATGSVAPELPANSAEGATVTDGSVVWTCVAAMSQGFRVSGLPTAAAPTYQITPTYQVVAPRFSAYSQLLDPIPDQYSRFFYRCLGSEMLLASTNPGDMARGDKQKVEALNALMAAMKQGDQELNVFQLLPASYPVERRWGNRRPYTADDPY